MGLNTGGLHYDYTQNAQPSAASTGEIWLDTSSSPPIPKAYDGTSWVRVEPHDAINSNLDASISSLNDLAQSDILSDGTPFDGSNIDHALSDIHSDVSSVDSTLNNVQSDVNSVDSTLNDVHNDVNSIEQGIDWSSKEVKASSRGPIGQEIIGAVNASGYIINLGAYSSSGASLQLSIDGGNKWSPDASQLGPQIGGNVSCLFRFDSSFTWEVTSSSQSDVHGNTMYVLD